MTACMVHLLFCFPSPTLHFFYYDIHVLLVSRRIQPAYLSALPQLLLVRYCLCQRALQITTAQAPNIVYQC